jgi:dihydrofolate synthase/folylpolyglutamate synthase
MDYPEALEYVHSFINYEKTMDWNYPEAIKLDRMQALVKALGNPQNAFDSVLIAGSKGKGSTAVFLASILRMENLRVGLYTSPHLTDIRERIRVNGMMISETRFVEYTLHLRRLLDDTSWRRNPPTFFEVLTALAFHHFREMKVHAAVLEVGLGGLYDSTNVAPAKAAGFAPVSLEHTDKLGKTIAKIAVQKAGILKGREIAVSAPQPPEAEAVLVKAALDNEATLYRVGKEIRVTPREYTDRMQRFDVKSPLGDFYGLETGLLGRHQLDNAAVAIGLAKGFEMKTHFKISEEAVRRGVLDAHWPGRLERVADRPIVVLDGAQNPESVQKLLAAVKRHFTYSKLCVVFGVSSDKDAASMLTEILPKAHLVLATRSSNPRALDPNVLADLVEGAANLRPVEDLVQAFGEARAEAGEDGLVLVTGSLFLVAEIRKLVLGDAG